MQFTVDTRNASAFELSALAEFVQKLASVNGHTVERLPAAKTLSASEAFENGNAAEINAALEAAELGNAVSTAIPAAPVSAPESESPPNVPAAPSVTPVPSVDAVPAAPSAVKLDSAGFPWDARINTANKGTVGDGTWRKKPGVAPELVESVRAELVAAGKVQAAASTTAPGVPAAPVTEPASPAPDLGNAAATGVIPAAPAPETAAPAVPTLTSQDVLARCTQIQMADMSKGSALFQAIVAAGVAGGPMALPSVTDPAVLAACLEAVNAVGAA